MSGDNTNMIYYISIGKNARASNLNFKEEDIMEFNMLESELKILFSKYCDWNTINIEVKK